MKRGAVITEFLCFKASLLFPDQARWCWTLVSFLAAGRCLQQRALVLVRLFCSIFRSNFASEGSVLAVDINKPPANRSVLCACIYIHFRYQFCGFRSAFPSNVTTAQMDVMKWNVSVCFCSCSVFVCAVLIRCSGVVQPSLRKTFDVILSDMAPSTTGLLLFGFVLCCLVWSI